MPTQLGDATEFLPIETATNPSTNHLDQHPDVEAKGESEHLEGKPRDAPQVVYDDQEDPAQRTGLRRLLRRNPSLDFIKEVAAANTTELDRAEVKKVS